MNTVYQSPDVKTGGGKADANALANLICLERNRREKDTYTAGVYIYHESALPPPYSATFSPSDFVFIFMLTGKPSPLLIPPLILFLFQMECIPVRTSTHKHSESNIPGIMNVPLEGYYYLYL